MRFSDKIMMDFSVMKYIELQSGDVMECKTIEKQIPNFLNDQMDEEMLASFMQHLKTCEDCKEELSIQYLSTEGLARLEEGDAFSLDEELDEIIGKANRKVRISHNIHEICNSFEFCFSVFLILAILFMLFK